MDIISESWILNSNTCICDASINNCDFCILYWISECQFSAFKSSSTTFEGSLNFSYSANLLTFVTIGAFTGYNVHAKYVIFM